MLPISIQCIFFSNTFKIIILNKYIAIVGCGSYNNFSLISASTVFFVFDL